MSAEELWCDPTIQDLKDELDAHFLAEDEIEFGCVLIVSGGKWFSLGKQRGDELMTGKYTDIFGEVNKAVDEGLWSRTDANGEEHAY